MTPTDLTGKAVHLRPLEEADAPLLTAWLSDPEVSAALFAGPAAGGADYRAEVAASEADLNLGIALCGGPLVGVVGLSAVDPRERSASLALFVGDKAAWGRGLGREAAALMIAHAFGSLGLERLWLQVAPSNARALRLYERLGFARLEQEQPPGGAILMELRRQDWRAPSG